ncbi:hypothetical protein HYH03_004460 [Edaphochlamys debaryana]|uniref:Uncharacterized protein n=1 Tax=Edaphochlamys debaryana TaxID=47281 RepID=A0A836C3I6_9CHLO|nr:hypothetical protein HYH03_004460 [Edaphochlamys debaryana]|eukprot:KAG2497724.1 hypothetical protein HYH03_004460 [Edaphochlamys debaryana]
MKRRRSADDVVDLTGDDNTAPAEGSLAQRVAKRQRAAAGAATRAFEVDDDDDDDIINMRDMADSDVEDISPEEFRQRIADVQQDEPADDDEDDDVIVTGAVGKVATRDFAHRRFECGARPFNAGRADPANGAHCPQCFCFVCDVKASECEWWGTGSRSQDHANARPTAAWTKLQEALKKGDRAAVAAKAAPTPRSVAKAARAATAAKAAAAAKAAPTHIGRAGAKDAAEAGGAAVRAPAPGAGGGAAGAGTSALPFAALRLPHAALVAPPAPQKQRGMPPAAPPAPRQPGPLEAVAVASAWPSLVGVAPPPAPRKSSAVKAKR